MNGLKSEGAHKAMVLLTRMFTVEMGFMGSRLKRSQAGEPLTP